MTPVVYTPLYSEYFALRGKLTTPSSALVAPAEDRPKAPPSSPESPAPSPTTSPQAT